MLFKVIRDLNALFKTCLIKPGSSDRKIQWSNGRVSQDIGYGLFKYIKIVSEHKTTYFLILNAVLRNSATEKTHQHP